MVNTRAESLTLEKVMCAVDELKKQGLKVTVKSVRDRTGCGSYTTISKLLKDVSLAEEKIFLLRLGSLSFHSRSKQHSCQFTKSL